MIFVQINNSTAFKKKDRFTNKGRYFLFNGIFLNSGVIDSLYPDFELEL